MFNANFLVSLGCLFDRINFYNIISRLYSNYDKRKSFIYNAYRCNAPTMLV